MEGRYPTIEQARTQTKKEAVPKQRRRLFAFLHGGKMHKLLQITLDKARQDEILISLMLTRKCPFECDHCFYGCSPRESGAYISDEVLSLVHDFYNELNTLEIKVRINLIGGEPTTNLSQFERVLSTGMEWEDFEGQPVKVEMVTNGWWLHRENSARRFFEIVKPYVMENINTIRALRYRCLMTDTIVHFAQQDFQLSPVFSETFLIQRQSILATTMRHCFQRQFIAAAIAERNSSIGGQFVPLAVSAKYISIMSRQLICRQAKEKSPGLLQRAKTLISAA
jgi:hypothetical protein